MGLFPTVIGEFVASANDIEAAGFLTVKKITFDVPPPGRGSTTVTEAVPATAMSAALIVAVNWPLLTNVVVRGLSFQSIVAPETNPEPFTVRVNPAPPGAALVGTTGLLIRGIGCGGAAWPHDTGTQKTKNDNSTANQPLLISIRTLRLKPRNRIVATTWSIPVTSSTIKRSSKEAHHTHQYGKHKQIPLRIKVHGIPMVLWK